MTKQSFLKGAFILLLASLLVKVMGFLYQIMIIRLISPEGVGIFNMVFPLYITVLVFSTMGLPPAIPKLTAEELAAGKYSNAEIILGTAVTLLVLFAAVLSFSFIVLAPFFIKNLYTDPRVLPVLLFLLPTIVLVAVSSALKGFFQGLQDMRPTAATQLIEQTVRIGTGLLLVCLLRPYGLTWSAVGLSLAVFCSELSGFIYLVVSYKHLFYGKLFQRPRLSTMKRLLAFGIPVTVTRVITSLVSTIEANLIPQQLKKMGYTLSQSTAFYGELTGVAFTLLTIPTPLTYSLSTTLVPAISEAASKKQMPLLSQRTSEALGITLIVGVPCSLILFFWGPLLSKLLFQVTQAGELLQILALGGVFLYLLQTTIGILQGLGLVKTIFFTTLLGGLVKLAGIYFYGAHAAHGKVLIALSFASSYVLVALLNLAIIARKTKLSFERGFYLRLLLVSVLFSMSLISLMELAAQSVFLLVLLTLTLILLFFLTLFLTGDQYVNLIFLHLSRILKRTP